MKFKKYIAFALIIMLINVGSINALNKNNTSFESNNQNSKILIAANNAYQNGSCDKDAIFGEKSNPDSLSYLINEILQYPRFIIPGLLIVLIGVDMFKAVISGKEEDMKKAQATAIKRLIMGTLVFLVPFFVNVIMWLADVAWQGLPHTC